MDNFIDKHYLGTTITILIINALGAVFNYFVFISNHSWGNLAIGVFNLSITILYLYLIIIYVRGNKSHG